MLGRKVKRGTHLFSLAVNGGFGRAYTKKAGAFLIDTQFKYGNDEIYIASPVAVSELIEASLFPTIDDPALLAALEKGVFDTSAVEIGVEEPSISAAVLAVEQDNAPVERPVIRAVEESVPAVVPEQVAAPSSTNNKEVLGAYVICFQDVASRNVLVDGVVEIIDENIDPPARVVMTGRKDLMGPSVG